MAMAVSPPIWASRAAVMSSIIIGCWPGFRREMRVRATMYWRKAPRAKRIIPMVPCRSM